MRILVLEAGKPDLADIVAGDLLALGGRLAAQFQPEGDVAQHGRPGQQREILKHEGAFRTGFADGAAVDGDRAGVSLDQPGDDLQKRRLPAAAGAEQAGQLAPGKVEVDAAQRLDIAVALGDAAHLNDGVEWLRHRRWAFSQSCVAHRQAPLFSGLKTRVSIHCNATSVRVERAMIEAMVAYISA